jgi:hypothetical protein
MTTNESPATETPTTPLDELISYIGKLEEDHDVNNFELIGYLKPFMPGPDFEALALSIEMCPIHLTDLDGCADDDYIGSNDPKYLDSMNLDVPFTACRHFRRPPHTPPTV